MNEGTHFDWRDVKLLAYDNISLLPLVYLNMQCIYGTNAVFKAHFGCHSNRLEYSWIFFIHISYRLNCHLLLCMSYWTR